MLVQNNIYRFNSLAKYPTLAHGVSSRIFGNMLQEQSLDAFAQAIGISKKQFILMEQKHTDKIVWITREALGTTQKETDAMLTDEKGIFLAVRTADCLPIFLYDKVRGYIGVIHAGWRGLYQEIISKTIELLKERGSEPYDVLVAIGPTIGSCCYEIGQELSETFLKKFSDKSPHFLVWRKKKVFLDLVLLAKEQLISTGITSERIEVADICTKETMKTFFSYRGDALDKSGRFISVIGILA